MRSWAVADFAIRRGSGLRPPQNVGTAFAASRGGRSSFSTVWSAIIVSIALSLQHLARRRRNPKAPAASRLLCTPLGDRPSTYSAHPAESFPAAPAAFAAGGLVSAL